MAINTAEFLKSSPKVELCPETKIPEFAFIGRSNVGKSSLINMLCGQKGLAKVSATPGKTQLINHFTINDSEWYLVDLPGYGFAKVPKAIREDFNGMIKGYLARRPNLFYTFVLIDSRHSAQKRDIDFFSWLGKNEVPFGIVFTKLDKLKPSEKKNNIEAYKNELLNFWEELPPIFTTSSAKNEGKTEIIDYIENIIREYC